VNRDQAACAAAEALNERCRCLAVDVDALRGEIERRLRAASLPADLAATHPTLFAQMPVFISGGEARQMATVVRAAEAAVALPAYREEMLALAPGIARHESGARGAFLGFDFHLSPDGPRLIEINTNAGGGFLAAMLGEAAVSCCGSFAVPGPASNESFERHVVGMLDAEWKLAGRTGAPARIAIVDAAPAGQYLYPEFLLAASAFERAGRRAVIAAPGELELRRGRLLARGVPVDLVYNRLCDFPIGKYEHHALRAAYCSGAAVVTPNPRAHALYADKRALGLLGDEAWLRSAGLEPRLAAVLGETVPRTFPVRREDAERLWRERRELFFKPFAGHGSRGAYRGDKVTRRVFGEILEGGYVAQALVPPSERVAAAEGDAPLKLDVRNYAYAGAVQLLAAWLWRGQTTNFRTEGGGFAPVFVLP
jgi:glutathione synthase/RimK-type ligase-like ATP-grasp enzyme